MKNLLLLFFLGFALFWVGCEKEEMINMPAITQIDESSRETLKTESISRSAGCCEFDAITFTYNDPLDVLEVGTVWDHASGFSRVNIRVLVNSVTFDTHMDLDSDEFCPGGGKIFSVPYSLFTECPSRIQVIASIETSDDGITYNRCTRVIETHKDYRAYSGEDVCGIPSDEGPTDLICYDELGQEIECP